MLARQVGPNQYINVWSKDDATHFWSYGQFHPIEDLDSTKPVWTEALALRAYLLASEAEQQVVRDMIEIILGEEDVQVQEMAMDTLEEALFPYPLEMSLEDENE